MKLYTLDNIKRNSNQNYLYDLFETKITQKSYTKVFWYMTTTEDAMRIDLICKRVYGSTDYVDEILTLNNIVDPLSITQGTLLLMFEPSDSTTLYVQDIDMSKDEDLVNVNKENKNDPGRTKSKKLPSNIKQDPKKRDINIDTGKVKINNNIR